MATPIIDALQERSQRPVIQQQVQRSPIIAQALLAQGMSPEPIDSGWEALGRLAQTWAGNRLQNELLAQEEAERTARAEELSEIMAGMNLNPEQARLIGQLDPDQQIEALLPLFAQATPETTDDIREFEYARANGFSGTFAEWQMMRPPSTQVTTTVEGDRRPQIGTIPQGWQVTQDPDTGAYYMEPIPGGPAAQEATAAEEAAAAGRTREVTQANIVVEDIGRALDAASVWTTGFIGARLDELEGTPAYDLKALTDTIRANVGFNQLQQMREASPTGGALGQVSERENVLLQSVLGSLDTAQSETQFRENLERLREVFLDIIHGGPNADVGGTRNWWIDEQGQINVGQPFDAEATPAIPLPPGEYDYIDGQIVPRQQGYGGNDPWTQLRNAP